MDPKIVKSIEEQQNMSTKLSYVKETMPANVKFENLSFFVKEKKSSKSKLEFFQNIT